MKEMTFKEALIAHLNGEKVEAKAFKHWEPFICWVSRGNATLCSALAESNFATDCEFRLAPATITINGVEIEAPFLPEDGEECWCFNMFGETHKFVAGATGMEERLIRSGDCFRTSEAAKAAFDAVSKALKA